PLTPRSFSCSAPRSHRDLHSFPTRRSSDLMMAACLMVLGRIGSIPRPAIACDVPSFGKKITLLDCGANVDEKASTLVYFGICGRDRKSTRLNSSHVKISYAVFCLKKKTKQS